MSPNEERLELERETADLAFANQHAHFNKAVLERLTPFEPDGYELPAPTITGMVRLCGKNRRNAKDRDTALPAELDSTLTGKPVVHLFAPSAQIDAYYQELDAIREKEIEKILTQLLERRRQNDRKNQD